MTNSITRSVLVIMLSLVCFSSQAALASATHLALYSEHEKPVYLAALTSKQAITAIPVAKSELNASTMALIFQRDYPIRQIVRHIGSWALTGNKKQTVYANSINSHSLAAIYRLNKQLFERKGQTHLEQGDVLTFAQQGSQTLISFNNQPISTVDDPVFYYYLANMWLGEAPASGRLQQQLLSQSPSLQALYRQSLAHDKGPEKTSTATQKTKTTGSNKTQLAAPATSSQKPEKPLAPSRTPATKKAKPLTPKLAAKPAATTTAAFRPLTKPSYKPEQLPLAQAQKANRQRLLLAIKQASFKIDIDTVDAVVLFTDQNGQVFNAKAVSSTLKDNTMLSKKIAFLSQDISPIATTKAMAQPGIYAFRINLKGN